MIRYKTNRITRSELFFQNHIFFLNFSPFKTTKCKDLPINVIKHFVRVEKSLLSLQKTRSAPQKRL